ncbi:MAG: hypothetical protein K2X55_10600 [Burkholderiaceae bacterium]|nr:hypothetical protein [Burkholderiaceae bacterium]MBY0239748.1 hypothetical protein [Burkholderiaceae bacterium]MBY0239749.1 hypothetical protein [Burkholderiaceae bacterium]
MANDIKQQVENTKAKVLDLQDLDLVDGGAAQGGELDAWSTISRDCVRDTEWSTMSEGC